MMRTPSKYFKREVRCARSLSAWIIEAGHDDRECQVMDISKSGSKIITTMPSQVPDRFELVFTQAIPSGDSVTLFGDAERSLAFSS